MARMAETIRHADLLPCESNKYMHSAPVAEDLGRFISDLDSFQPTRQASGDTATDRVAENARDLQEPSAP